MDHAHIVLSVNHNSTHEFPLQAIGNGYFCVGTCQFFLFFQERRKNGDPGDNEGANPIEPTPKLAKKKIRGSTVVSAKMEKAMRTGRKRTRKT